MTSNRLIFLGSGDAFSAGGSHQACYLLQRAEGALLLDCGPGVLGSLNRHGLSAAPIDTVLISHFHGDHIGGLPFLFLHFTYVEERSKPLRIVGPPGVEARVGQLFRAMYADAASTPLPYALQFIEAVPGAAFSLDGIRVEAFAVPHLEYPQSYGYDIRFGNRKVVYSGDTGWTEELPARSAGADLFICECSFFETRLETHLDYPRIAENLGRFGARRMVLTHLGREVLERRGEIALELASDGLSVAL